MSITFSCSCGKQSDLPESFLGKRVRCNFCGTLSIVSLPSMETAPELDWETHIAESLLGAATAGSGGGTNGTGVLEAELVAEPPVFDEVSSSGEIPQVVAEAVDAPPLAPVANPMQYKVLTQRDKWFGGKFDAERLEQALNFLAQQGWVVRSMVAGTIGGISGNREELVVLLERG
jgi:Domain of unknown function (DUF4177)